jgi:hypothetical protein
VEAMLDRRHDCAVFRAEYGGIHCHGKALGLGLQESDTSRRACLQWPASLPGYMPGDYSSDRN